MENNYVNSLTEVIGKTPLIKLKNLFKDRDVEVLAKLEMYNPGGSMKDRPALYIIQNALREGFITKESHIIESSSGNLGVALAMVCNLYNLKFTCVIDPNISLSNFKIIKLYGANIVMVDTLDKSGGYIGSRIEKVKKILKIDDRAFWINQYANQNNWKAHYFGTGTELINQIEGDIDIAVIPISSSGSIMGIGKIIKERHPKARIIAIDVLGSTIFQPYMKSPKSLPGIGSSHLPDILDKRIIDEVILVSDYESVLCCQELLIKEGIFAGGSSGSVIAGLKKLLPRVKDQTRIVTLFPDRGDRYLETVYNPEWCSKLKKEHDNFKPNIN